MRTGTYRGIGGDVSLQSFVLHIRFDQKRFAGKWRSIRQSRDNASVKRHVRLEVLCRSPNFQLKRLYRDLQLIVGLVHGNAWYEQEKNIVRLLLSIPSRNFVFSDMD